MSLRRMKRSESARRRSAGCEYAVYASADPLNRIAGTPPRPSASNTAMSSRCTSASRTVWWRKRLSRCLRTADGHGPFQPVSGAAPRAHPRLPGAGRRQKRAAPESSLATAMSPFRHAGSRARKRRHRSAFRLWPRRRGSPSRGYKHASTLIRRDQAAQQPDDRIAVALRGRLSSSRRSSSIAPG